MPLESWALLTMDEAKEYLNLPSGTDEAFLAEVINATTEAVEGYTKRKLASRTYTSSIFDGSGAVYLKLREYPVTAVSAVAFLDTDDPVTWTTQTATVAIEEPVKDRIFYRTQ